MAGVIGSLRRSDTFFTKFRHTAISAAWLDAELVGEFRSHSRLKDKLA